MTRNILAWYSSMPYSIAIISPSPVPFQIGGAEKFWWGLHRALSTYSNHTVELLKLPCREDTFADLLASYRMFSELDLSHFNMVITSKYPAWMVNHPCHILYMQHPLRGLYDTYHFTGLPEQLNNAPAPLRDLINLIRKDKPNRTDLRTAFELCDRALNTKSLPSDLFTFPGPLIRELVRFFDSIALAPDQITAYLAISETVRLRPDYFPSGANVKVLHHPSDITEYLSAPGKYIFTASRLTSMKRLHLIVEAMRYVQADIPLKIAGTGPELEHLKCLAADDSRIEFLGHVPDTKLPALYAGALFVPFVPYDEDYGLITIEAMSSGKPVITTHDAGGVCEFVEHGVTGFCVDPTPEALGSTMQQLAASPKLAVQMGNNARKRVAHITWKTTVRELLSHAAQTTAKHAQGARRKVLICAPFAAAKHGSGGQRRLYYLCEALAEEFHVLLICMGTQTQQTVESQEIMPHVHELRLPWTEEGITEALRLQKQNQISDDDLAIMLTCIHHTTLLETLHTQGTDAACVIVSHPYLYPAIAKALPHIPLVYDAHNVEADMKALLLAETLPELLQEVNTVERECCLTAQSILTCSKADAKRFTTLYGVDPDRCHLVPNGCNSATVRFADTVQRKLLRRRLDYPDARLALFMGSGHKPNQEAAAHIISMAAQLPEVQFLLAGSVSTQTQVRELPRPDNVHLVGIVSESVKNLLLQAADVGLNPMTSGAGTNLKIIEYVMSGLESVSTLFGMRGLEGDFTPAVHICGLEDFPVHIRRVLESPSPSNDLAAAAARTAKRYAWSVTMRPLCHIINNLRVPAKDTVHATAH